MRQMTIIFFDDEAPHVAEYSYVEAEDFESVTLGEFILGIQNDDELRDNLLSEHTLDYRIKFFGHTTSEANDPLVQFDMDTFTILCWTDGHIGVNLP